MSQEATVILNYLQNDCSDYWSAVEVEGGIHCYWAGDYRFTIEKEEDGDWLISGSNLSLDILHTIAELLGCIEEEEL
jgi:hypothetical protein